MIRVLLVLGAIFENPIMSAAAESSTLAALVGKDLRTLAADELSPVLRILGGDKDRTPFGPTPWYVWRTSQRKPDRFVVFEGKPMLIIPGASSARIHLFDEHESSIKTWSFSTGWRIDLTGASFQYSPELAADLITINSERVVGGGTAHRQYIGFTNDDLRLIRIEDEDRRVLPNVYVFPNHTLGPRVDNVTQKGWMSLIESTNKVDLLAALTYLGGQHMDLSRPEPGADGSDIKRAQMAQELRRNHGVQDIVLRHRKSENKWVAEAAGLAAQRMGID